MISKDSREFITPFNSPVELGFRALVLLNETYPNAYSLRHLVILDYFVVHSDDIDNGPEGLHPQTPYRSGELLVRREPLQKGLSLFHSRGLIEKQHLSNGLFYAASDRSESFLAMINAEYYLRLAEKSKWVVSEYGDVTIETLETIVNENLGRWGAEFEMASVLWKEGDGV